MKFIRTAGILVFMLVIISLAFISCRKDELNNDTAFRLKFSSDTVIFDTVFTSIGSITKSLVIHNTGNSRINISSITLARGKSSPFRLNIDGTASGDFHDLEIGANDSAYIFVRVTIDPKNASNPLIESDSIVFRTNGNTQDVKLVAWGQDAYFHLNETLKGDITLATDKPHVVYGKLLADNGCKLKIAEGTKLYFHSNSWLEIRSGASLNVSGTLEHPVIFTCDRLDDNYNSLPGLWGGIWLEKGSKNISFTYAEITNAKTGIQADSIGIDGNEPLNLHNCLVNNMSNIGIKATRTKIIATNCQITNCGGAVLSVEQGGNYDFRNCTLAQYFSSRYPAISISNYVMDTSGKIKIPGDLTGAYFGNCIISGNKSGEVEFSEIKDAQFNFQFEQCLVNWNKDLYKGTNYESKFTKCLSKRDSIFINPSLSNFQLDTLSAAINAASVNIINNTFPDITHDRKGVSRLIPGPPDLGAYERVEKIRK